MSTPRRVLVTGAGSGFGLRLAKSLLEGGHTVFATMRDPTGRNAAVAAELEAHDGGVHVLDLDVAADASVGRAVGEALAAAGGLDVVVNNAGIGAGGYAEAFTVDQYRDLFEVNVFGVQRVMRAVLPSMREARRGLIVNVSSIMGRIVIPFSGPYTATKWALEGLTESYRYELLGTGVDVVLVEPGGFPTGLGERLLTPRDGARHESYGELKDRPETMWGGFMERLTVGGGPDPQLVADAIVALIDAPAGERPLRTVVDPFMGGEPPSSLNAASDAAQARLLENLGFA